MKRLSAYLFITICCLLAFSLLAVNYSFAGDCSLEKKTTPRNELPSEMLNLKNPLTSTNDNLENGKRLYLKDAKPAPCYRCHGTAGKADGMMAKFLKPSPRNFTCKNVMSQITDGEMFWLIRNGAKGSGMAPFPEKLLDDDDLWKIILFIRELGR